MASLLDDQTLLQSIERIVRPNLKFLDEGAPLAPDQNLGELGLDSLASINLLIDLETELDVAIPDEAIDENTFTSLANLEAVLKMASAA